MKSGAQTLTMKIFNYKRVPYAEIRAFSVHILTAVSYTHLTLPTTPYV